MKKIILILSTVMATSLVTAQIRFDAEGLKKKIVANDEAINNPKKNVKPGVWIDRGNLYYQLATGATEGLYAGMGQTEIDLICGKPTASGTETIVNPTNNAESKSYTTMQYPNFVLYLENGKLSFWKPLVEVDKDALDKAYESYLKAVSLDQKVASKVKENILNVANAYAGVAQNTLMPQHKYIETAKALGKSYDIAKNPIANRIDTSSAYNAGYIAMVMHDFELAAKYLPEAEKLQFYQNGDIYYYLFITYKGLNNLVEAEKVLNRGIEKYPTKKELVDSRIELYMTTDRDLNTILPEIDKALANDPNNFGLYFNKAIILDKLNRSKEAIEMFKKASQINPKDYGSQYNVGIIYSRLSDALIPVLNEIPYSKEAEYNAKLKEIKDLKRKAIEHFEAAYEINPEDQNVIDALRRLFLVFRDESPEMLKKYEKYQALYKGN